MEKNQVLPQRENPRQRGDERRGEPQPIGEVLAELLACYQQRFPGARIALVETPAAAACSC
jgi:hypothetical protein